MFYRNKCDLHWFWEWNIVTLKNDSYVYTPKIIVYRSVDKSPFSIENMWNKWNVSWFYWNSLQKRCFSDKQLWHWQTAYCSPRKRAIVGSTWCTLRTEVLWGRTCKHVCQVDSLLVWVDESLTVSAARLRSDTDDHMLKPCSKKTSPLSENLCSF